MNELDFILLFIVALGAAIGFRRGVIRVLISIFGILVTVLVVGYVYSPMAATVSDAFGLRRVMTINASYLVVLVAMTVIVELVSRSAFEDTSIASLRRLDNLLGGLVGVWYGGLWASLLLVPVQYGIAVSGGTWTDAVYTSELVPVLNEVFRNSVLDLVRIFFVNGVPSLFQPTFLI